MIIPKYWAEEKITKKFGGSNKDTAERFKKIYTRQHKEKPNFDESDPKEVINYAQKLI